MELLKLAYEEMQCLSEEQIEQVHSYILFEKHRDRIAEEYQDQMDFAISCVGAAIKDLNE